MVKCAPDVSRLFSALANPTRRRILEILRCGEEPISDLAEPFDMSLVAVSKHVRVLEDAGLLTVRKEGRSRICRLDARPLRVAVGWMAPFLEFWRAELDQVERFLAHGPDEGRGREHGARGHGGSRGG